MEIGRVWVGFTCIALELDLFNVLCLLSRLSRRRPRLVVSILSLGCTMDMVRGSLEKDSRMAIEAVAPCCCSLWGLTCNHSHDVHLVSGGPTVAQWLEQQMSRIVGESWEQYPPEEAISRAFLEADKKLLQVPGGFFGAFGRFSHP